jgi:septum formation protein
MTETRSPADPPGAHPFWLAAQPLVLASGSRARRLLLEAAGIPLVVRTAEIDEAAIAADLLIQGASPAMVASALADRKAEAAVRLSPDRLLLAADQTLDFEGALAMKPESPDQAREQLLRMRGKSHHLHSAAVLRLGSEVLWAGTTTATLRMRAVSEVFLASYLAHMGSRICDTVGGYELEAAGIHLFDRIEGDHPTILGLPLMSLLEALRVKGILAA